MDQRYLLMRKFRYFVISFCIVNSLCCSNIFAQPTYSTYTGSYSCSLGGTSLHNPPDMYGFVATVYDDSFSNYIHGSYGDENCNRRFLFAEHTGVGTNIALTFQYNGSIYPTPPVTKHDVYIYNNAIDSNLTSSGPVVISDFDTATLSSTIYTLSSTYTSIAGELEIAYYRHGDTVGIDSPDIRGRIVLFPQIQKLWIDATPICPGFTGNYYFKVHAVPELASIIQATKLYGHRVGLVCGPTIVGAYGINIDFSGSSTTVNPFYNFLVTSEPPEITGYGWGVLGSTPPNNDLTDYWIDSTAISSYLSGAPGTSSPIINLTFSDGIDTMSASASIIIEYPAVPASLYAGTPGGTPSGPPNAIGIPWPSYDIYDYNVSGHEIWTPTNNPVTNMQNGDTINIIRIQDTLHIPAGATLELQTGMRLEMGPHAVIAVDHAADKYSWGGQLDLASSTITAYRGCTDLTGTDTSTWGGIILNSNPAWPQPLGTSSTPNPQGMLWFQNSVISYADIAVQTGTDAAHGGGSILALGPNTFYNNKEAVRIYPYHNISGGIEHPCNLNLNNSTFLNDGNVWFGSPDFVNATQVKTVGLYACTFTNSTTATMPAAVNVNEESALINGGSFTNFQIAVNASYASASHSLLASSATFTNNHIAIQVNGGVAPAITGNTINIPPYLGGGSTMYATDVVYVNDQNIGALLMGSSGYNVSKNIFQTAATTLPEYYSYTTGTIEWNTGSDPNEVTGNKFSHIGAAMQGNFINSESGAQGLRYLCDTNAYNGYDIAVCGIDGPPGAAGPGGISGFQFSYNPSTTYAPAGNLFSNHVNIFNHLQPLSYWYNPSIAGENPATTYGAITVNVLSNSPTCNIVSGLTAYSAFSANQLVDPVLHYAITNSNVNYYLTDTNGITHRDSLYYWATQMHTAYGDLLIANLLVEDSFIDSANTVYNAITTNYTLDSTEAVDFAQGRYLMDVLITNRINNRNIMALDSGQVDTLRFVAANAYMWAHSRAESWLNIYEGDPTNDTLLYPQMPPPPLPGVLAVTEISNGPSGDCEFAQMLVANCGTDSAAYVDVSGWIIDDNSGNFDTHGCGLLNISSNIGHYRLEHSPTWQKVPVGSTIVMYNHDANCYDLPDTFRVDTNGSTYIYWIPIGGTASTPYGNPHVERFLTLPRTIKCNYCSGDSSLPYVKASAWEATIGLDNAGDALQVRCPGCDSLHPGEPAFYHGIAYGSATGLDAFEAITAGTNDLGGAFVSGSGTGNKYVFTGTIPSEFGDYHYWTKSTADAAGSIPFNLGHVSKTLYSAAVNHTLGLPCCGTSGRARNGAPTPSLPGSSNGSEEVKDISVYPNPASSVLYFQYPLSEKITIRITDITGRLMDEQVLENSTLTSISVANYTPGIYLYQVITDNKTQAGKVLIGK